jgi:L-seryl-tRNA(Ser) seleniumtransferase
MDFPDGHEDGAAVASRAAAREVLESLGLRPVINALGAGTQLGCATLSPRVRAAMDAAAQHYVPLSEMQERASRAIVKVTGAEAGCVASGGEACLFLAAAACITGADPAAMDRLPDTEGLPNEIVIHRAHRNPFDHALRGAGAKLIEFGYVGPGSGVGVYRWQLEAAISDRTAALLYVSGPEQLGVLPFEVVVDVAHARGVPVIVDAATEPVRGLRDLIAGGADLVATSGGKILRGPAGSGLLAGRLDLIRVATMQQRDVHVHPQFWSPPFSAGCPEPLATEPPHQGIGRSFKVGREELAGLIVALEVAADADAELDRRRWHAICDTIVRAIDGAGGASATVSPRYPHVNIQLKSADHARGAVVALASGNPRIWVNAVSAGSGQIIVSPTELREEEIPHLTDRLYEVLAAVS